MNEVEKFFEKYIYIYIYIYNINWVCLSANTNISESFFENYKYKMASNAMIQENVAFKDGSIYFLNGTDTSQSVTFDVETITSARTITLPDINVDLGNIDMTVAAATSGYGSIRFLRNKTLTDVSANKEISWSAGVFSGMVLASSGVYKLDGQTILSGDSILIKDEYKKWRNGIYTVTISGTSLTFTRHTSFDETGNFVKGDTFKVINGDKNGDKIFSISVVPTSLNTNDTTGHIEYRQVGHKQSDIIELVPNCNGVIVKKYNGDLVAWTYSSTYAFFGLGRDNVDHEPTVVPRWAHESPNDGQKTMGYVEKILAAYYNIYVVDDNNDLYATGYNANGQFGENYTTGYPQTFPVFKHIYEGVSDIRTSVVFTWVAGEEPLYIKKTSDNKWYVAGYNAGSGGINLPVNAGSTSDVTTFTTLKKDDDTEIGTGVRDLWHFSTSFASTFLQMDNDDIFVSGGNYDGNLGLGTDGSPNTTNYNGFVDGNNWKQTGVLVSIASVSVAGAGYTIGTYTLTGASGSEGELYVSAVDGSGIPTVYNIKTLGAGYTNGETVTVSGGTTSMEVVINTKDYVYIKDCKGMVYYYTGGGYVTEGVTFMLLFENSSATSGIVVAAGENAYYQTGTSTTSTASFSKPRILQFRTDNARTAHGDAANQFITKIDYTGRNGCALSENNKFYAWGDRTYGVLGGGDVATYGEIPTIPSNLTNIVADNFWMTYAIGFANQITTVYVRSAEGLFSSGGNNTGEASRDTDVATATLSNYELCCSDDIIDIVSCGVASTTGEKAVIALTQDGRILSAGQGEYALWGADYTNDKYTFTELHHYAFSS